METPEQTGQSNFVRTESDSDCPTCGEDVATCGDLRFEEPPGKCCDGCKHEWRSSYDLMMAEARNNAMNDSVANWGPGAH